MTKKLIVAACVAFALSLANIHAQNAPGPKGQGGPAVKKQCPQPECPMDGQGPCGQGMGKGQGGPGKGMGKCDGSGQGMGKGQGKCDGTGPKRDGSGPNCPRQNEL